MSWRTLSASLFGSAILAALLAVPSHRVELGPNDWYLNHASVGTHVFWWPSKEGQPGAPVIELTNDEYAAVEDAFAGLAGVEAFLRSKLP